MGYSCELSSEPHYLVVLLYLSVGFGALVSTIQACIFLLKWHFQMDQEFAKQLTPRLSAVVVMCIVFERVLRLFEVYLLYKDQPLLVEWIYHINNLMSGLGIFVTLMVLWVRRLVQAYQGSIFEVPNETVRVLYALIVIELGLSVGFWIMNGTSEIDDHTKPGVLMLFILFGLGACIVGLTFTVKVNIELVSRLQSLVAESLIHGRRTELNAATNNAIEDSRVAKQPTLFRIRTATISNFRDQSHKMLLRTSTKSTVISIWISISFLFVLVSAALFAAGDCADPTAVCAHLTLCVAYTVIIVSISFSLPNTQAEYQYICGRTDRLLSKLVAFWTSEQVMQLVLAESPTPGLPDHSLAGFPDSRNSIDDINVGKQDEVYHE